MAGITFQANDVLYTDLKDHKFRINDVKTHVIFSGSVRAEPGGRRGVSVSLRGGAPPTEVGLATLEIPPTDPALATYTLPTVFIRLPIGDDPELIRPNRDYVLEIDPVLGSSVEGGRCSFCIMEG